MTAGLFIVLVLAPSAQPQTTLPPRQAQVDVKLTQTTLPVAKLPQATVPASFRWVAEPAAAKPVQAKPVMKAKKSSEPCCSPHCTCGCNDGEECSCKRLAAPAAQPAVTVPWVAPTATIPQLRPYYGQPMFQPAMQQFAAPSFSGGFSSGFSRGSSGGSC
jgi:hypothetical protein